MVTTSSIVGAKVAFDCLVNFLDDGEMTAGDGMTTTDKAAGRGK